MTSLTGPPQATEPQIPERGAARLHWISAYINGSESQIEKVIDLTKKRYGSHDQWAKRVVRTITSSPSRSNYGLQRGTKYFSREGHINVTTESSTYARLIVSGQGTDLIATIHEKSAYDEELWKGELLWLTQTGWTFSRIDVTFDDLSSKLDFDVIRKHSLIYDPKLDTMVKNPQRGGKLINQSEGIRSIYYGVQGETKKLGDFGVRIYERKPKDLGVRVETQLRRKYAREFASIIIREGFDQLRHEIPKRVYFRVVNQNLRSKKHQWEKCRWWTDFFLAVKPLQQPEPKKPKSELENLLFEFERSYGSLLALILETPKGVSHLAQVAQKGRQTVQANPHRQSMRLNELRSNAREIDGKPFDISRLVDDLSTLIGPWMFLLLEATQNGSSEFAELLERSRQSAERMGLSVDTDGRGTLNLRAHFIHDGTQVSATKNKQAFPSIWATRPSKARKQRN